MKKKSEAYKRLRKIIFSFLKEKAKTNEKWYYCGFDHTLTIPVECPLQKDANEPDVAKACCKVAGELVELLKPLIKHDKIVKQSLQSVYPKYVFKQTFCLGVWSEDNKYPAQILTVWAAVGGPYGKVGISTENAIDRLT